MNTEKTLNTDPFRRRFAWWTDPGAIVLFVIMIGAGIYIEFFAVDLGYKNVVIIFGVFWGIFTIFLMLFYKKAQYETHTVVKGRVLERTKEDLDQHRSKVREDFVDTELAVLERGETTTVFDSWRLQRAILESHPFFPKLELTEINPSVRELHIRIQLEHQLIVITETKGFERGTLAQVLRFLTIVFSDAQAKTLGKFFDCAVLELYALREDSEGRDVPYPFFSLLALRKNFSNLASSGHVTMAQLQKLAEVRFDGGREIDPHRHLQPGAAQRGK
jgi:hypothetical protein